MAKITTKKKTFIVTHWMFGATYACVILAIVLVGVKFALHAWMYKSLFVEQTYQAVTLNNGQTFFGRLQQYGPGTLVLFDVYYLQSSSATTDTTEEPTAETATGGLQLVKLTDDIHQPLNHLVINRDSLVYWQNLDPNSPILDAIARGSAE